MSRADGDWDGWMQFYLVCVQEAAQDGIAVCQRIFALAADERRRERHPCSSR
jgi:hypothetical protein